MLRRFLSLAQEPFHRPDAADAAHKLKRVDPGWLLWRLPDLGNVLFVRAADSPPVATAPHCPLVDGASVPLLGCRWLLGCSQITSDGPHEWCQCVDAQGRVLARMYLLPDTDFLAWDELWGDSDTATLACRMRVACPFRPACARVVRFRMAQVAGLTLLRQSRPSAPYSSFSRGVATRLAGAQALPLS